MSERDQKQILISTIIPVLNDDAALKRCLYTLSGCARSDVNEVIVADGGNSDACREISLQFGATYLNCAPGRATQMNRASEIARGHWLWFLHADCIPHVESLSALIDSDAQWGCFRHRINARSWRLRAIECADNLRAKLAGMPYGDQGIFVQSKTFRSLGGYADVPLLEDVILARQLSQLSRPRVLKPLLTTDARRWIQRGVGATTLLNWRIMFEFLTERKTPHDLAALYRKK